MRNVVFIGQLTDMSGYGNASRNYLKSLSKIEKINLKCINFSFESREFKCDLVDKYNLVNTRNIKQGKFSNDDVKTIFNYLGGNEYDVIFFLPNDWLSFGMNSNSLLFNDRINLHKICQDAANVYPCVVWETNKVPESWAKSYNSLSNIDKLICACSWNASVFNRETKKDFSIIPYSVEQNLDYDQSFYQKLINIKKDRFSFCNVSQWNDRKGMEEMIRSFYCEFWNDDVLLFLKTYINESQAGATDSRDLLLRKINNIKNSINHYGKNIDFKCNVVLIDTILSKEKIYSIYKASDAYLTCTKGEGFGLPIAEFLMSNNKPVITPDKGGHLDFCGDSNIFIKSEYQPTTVSQHPHYSELEMESVEVSLISVRKKMREAIEINKSIDFSKDCREYLSRNKNVKLFKEVLGIK
tara:strand:+ start:245 stop:1477 length:1233 start_codon:yes stop_codon:yes gene_type:complete